jgi:hypothetical protein
MRYGRARKMRQQRVSMPMSQIQGKIAIEATHVGRHKVPIVQFASLTATSSVSAGEKTFH